MLFDLVAPGDVLGTLTAAAAAATGLPAGVPVVATANDKAVEALGCGLVDSGGVLVSLGTYVAGMVVGDRWAPDLQDALDELRVRARPVPLREPRGAARDVDRELAARPARRRAGDQGGQPTGVASRTS